MACKESEWDAREKAFKLATGRPRLLTLDGKERLLDDELTEALPVWSPDSSKVATAFDTDVMLYDAATNKPTQARIRLRDALIAASRVYEEENAGGKKKSDDENKVNNTAPSAIPASFNPIIRLEWTSPEKVLFETAYVLLIPNDPINLPTLASFNLESAGSGFEVRSPATNPNLNFARGTGIIPRSHTIFGPLPIT